MRSIPRTVTVWCADWPVVAAGAAADRPAAVFRADRVVAATRAARSSGVSSGQRRRAAQAAIPDLSIVEYDGDRDARAFEPIVRVVADSTPRVEVVEPGWITFAARGPSRYFGGDEALADRLADLIRRAVHDVAGAGFERGGGSADGRTASAIAARRAARRTGVMVVDPGASPSFLAPLPTGWLAELGEISSDLVELFVRLGLGRLGDLAALDRADVVSRFGVEGRLAHRLASGDDERPPDAVDPPPDWCIEHVFPEPVDRLDTVVFVAKRLADELTDRLSGSGRVCIRTVVVVETEHGERSERVWYRDAGLSASAMVERVRWQLEGWVTQPDGPNSGISLLRFVPDLVRGDDGVPTRLWGGRSSADLDAARAIVRLSGLAGSSAVQVPVWAGGRSADERYRWVAADLVDLDDPSGRLDRPAGPWPGALPAPFPALVGDAPSPGEVVAADGSPVVVTGRGEVSAEPTVLVVGGRRCRVVSWAGPWPVEERWWHPSGGRRLARFQMVTDLGEAHLIARERRRWVIAATYA
ncbi:MAG: DNA polymerase Y family protein [Ilumatobacteraceae bacterium]